MLTKTLGVLAIGSALLLGSAAAARAGDFCIHPTITSDTLVLKGFTLPAKGACKEARGFWVGSLFTSGSACRSSDGDDVFFNLTTVGVPGTSFREIDSLVLHVSSDQGSVTYCTLDGSCFGEPIVHVNCGKTIPIP